MGHVLPTLLAVAVAVVVAVLLTGVAGFAKGGPWYQRHANHLMNLRVTAQLAAVLLFALAVWLSG
jgi:Mn2+/Fe2+ NRAMP family transporter